MTKEDLVKLQEFIDWVTIHFNIEHDLLQEALRQYWMTH